MPLVSDKEKKIIDELDQLQVGQKFNAGSLARRVGLNPYDIDTILDSLRPSYDLRKVSIGVWMREHPAAEFERRLDQAISRYSPGTTFTALDVVTVAEYDRSRGREVLSYLIRRAETYRDIQPADELIGGKLVKIFRKV